MGAARAEDAQGTPTQSHISPSILVYEDHAHLAQGEEHLFGAHLLQHFECLVEVWGVGFRKMPDSERE